MGEGTGLTRLAARLAARSRAAGGALLAAARGLGPTVARPVRAFAAAHGIRAPRSRLPVVVAVGLLALPLLVSPVASRPEAPDLPAASAASTAVAPERSEVEPAAPTPGPTPGVTAAQQETVAPPLPDTVQPLRPDLVLRPAQAVQPDGLFAALGIPGVQHLTGAVELGVTVAGPGGPAQITLLVVDPVAFRPLTPEVTAQARAVWERVVDGELAVRHDVAQRLQLPLGETLQVTGPSGSPVGVRVGAFASNGTPPLADAIVSWDVGARLGASAPNLLVVAVADDVAPEAVGDQLVSALGGGQVTPIAPPQEQQARLVGAGSTRFEPFSYIDHGDGMITIDPAWVRKWIVTAELPIFGGVARCHRVMMPQLIAALREVEAAGLAHLIDRNDYGGCWVPRHILFDPSRPLSMHAWGLAVDFNVQTNQYGAAPTMDPRIVTIFERWGFRWGGTWSTPDGMHFELAAVIQGEGG